MLTQTFDNYFVVILFCVKKNVKSAAKRQIYQLSLELKNKKTIKQFDFKQLTIYSKIPKSGIHSLGEDIILPGQNTH